MSSETIQHLKSLESIRSRAILLFENPNQLENFDLNLEKLESVATDIIALIKRDYKTPHDIPPHSRWRHFEASATPKSKIDRIGVLLAKWKEQEGVSTLESVRRLLDLFVVGVLLDAGAGSEWKYKPEGEGGAVYNRSEGLGVASFDLFNSGILSSKSSENPHQVDSIGLSLLTADVLGKHFQVSDGNPLVGK